jgi:CPA2 family monovalent cation:H+ antiporter-2
MYVAIADGFECGGVVDHARKAARNLTIIARAHSEEEAAHLIAHGADRIVMGEAEIARGMLDSEPTVAPDVAEQAAETVAVAFVTSESDQILDDAERAVLAALRAFDIWPGEAISWPAIRDAALQRGFEGERLDAASHSLRRKDLIRDLDDERITLTRPGFLAAPQAA